MQIHTWFPTLISISENLLTDEENNKLIELLKQLSHQVGSGGKNWISDVYNSLTTHNLTKDRNFDFFIDKVNKQLSEHCEHLKTDYTYKCTDAWFNIYNNGDYQEFHSHAGSVFSSVYYVTNPKQGGRIFFENPYEPDMMPPKNYTEFNDFNSSLCNYQPDPKTLLIFRSNLRHMVEKCHNSKENPRVTIALNYGY